MAIADIRGTQLYIKIGDGASPEMFAHPCLINAQRGIAFTSSANKIVVPDCDNPDDPAWSEVVKDGMSASVTGSGTLDTTDLATWDTWFRDDVAKNIKVYVGTAGSWLGAFKLTSWNITGERNNKAQVSVTIDSDGVVGTYTPGA